MNDHTPIEFICRAANAHDDLVAALKAVAAQHALFVGPDDDIANATKEIVRAALAKASASCHSLDMADAAANMAKAIQALDDWICTLPHDTYQSRAQGRLALINAREALTNYYRLLASSPEAQK